VVLHSVHPLCAPRRLYEELGEDCELTGDEVTVGICYPDTLADGRPVRRDLRPMLRERRRARRRSRPVIVVLAGYHRDLLNR
jgi:hypothetical protein